LSVRKQAESEAGVPPMVWFAGRLMEATSQRSFSMEYASEPGQKTRIRYYGMACMMAGNGV
jgi:hypothetical protein